MIIYIIFIILMFFAWAIGGEEGFGKWKRGILLSFPMTLLALTTLPWYMVILQFGVLWAVYQALFYDDGIKLVYTDEGDTKLKKILGWVIIVANGFIVSLSALAFMFCAGVFKSILAMIVTTLVFVGAVIISNDMRFASYRAWLFVNAPKYPYLNFKDAWYVSEGIIGVGIALSCLILS